MDGVAGIRMRTRGAESLFGGPSPSWRKLLKCSNVPDQMSYSMALTYSGGERLDVLWICEQSGNYDRIWLHSGAKTGSPDLRVEVFAADMDGSATGSVLATQTVTPFGGTIETLALATPLALVAGKGYVFRFTAVTSATSLLVHCNAGSASDGVKLDGGLSCIIGTYADSAGQIKGFGIPVFGVSMTLATFNSKTFGTGVGSTTGGFVDCIASSGTLKRVGFGHVPTEDRMVYTIRAMQTLCKGNPANANRLSAFIYEWREPNWVQVYKSVGKKTIDVTYPQSIIWFIPQGFLLHRGSEYVVCIGPSEPGEGNSTDCMRIAEIGQYSLIPRAVCAGQYGGIGEEAAWPAAYNSTSPPSFSKSNSGSGNVSTPIAYNYRVVPTVILP